MHLNEAFQQMRKLPMYPLVPLLPLGVLIAGFSLISILYRRVNEMERKVERLEIPDIK